MRVVLGRRDGVVLIEHEDLLFGARRLEIAFAVRGLSLY